MSIQRNVIAIRTFFKQSARPLAYEEGLRCPKSATLSHLPLHLKISAAAASMSLEAMFPTIGFLVPLVPWESPQSYPICISRYETALPIIALEYTGKTVVVDVPHQRA